MIIRKNLSLKPIFLILCISLCKLYCAEKKEYCWGPQHMYVGARYTTPKGIGYHNGYTTLEGFLLSNFLRNTWLPFLDVRGHVFDNGKLAANAGLGLRYLACSRFWGVNVYYDYRNSSHEHYNQVAAGFETLGKIWDFRINGYLPVGEKRSHRFHNSADFPRELFAHSILSILCHERGKCRGRRSCRLLQKRSSLFCWRALLFDRRKRQPGEGKLRARVDLFHHYLRIEGNTSYDHLFKWIGQAQVSVNIPFGGRSNALKKRSLCSRTAVLLQRAAAKGRSL